MKQDDFFCEDYSKHLQSWVRFSIRYLYICPDRKDLECYGTGSNEWGVQTNQKAFAAFAVVATDPFFDENRIGLERQKIIDHALGMLRFSLETHIEGSYHCTDGTSWGHTWISSLGIERMMHGIEALEEYFTNKDKEMLQKVIISECDWLMDHYDIVAGVIENNKPESNLWNGAILHRATLMYPHCKRADEYKEKGTRFLINSISIASDKNSRKLVDGKLVSELYIGDNFFESYALNHHGYLNVGYMVICLSNVATLHFSYKKRGIKPPQALYHHVEDLWRLIKLCIFPDGRLLRIGGDTRVRYCYCQDYAIPLWLLIEDYLGEIDCVSFEKGWLGLIEQEVRNNGDGSFLSDRCGDLEKISPLYYTRLESDRAVTLSMGLYWRRTFEFPQDALSTSENFSGLWKDNYHGACMVRGDKRVASFTWRGAEGPLGLCLPVNKSNMAEWRGNLTGQIRGLGHIHNNEIVYHEEKSFEGGFLTWGKVKIHGEKYVSEGQNTENIADQYVVFAALPDDSTVMVIQYAKSSMRIYLTSVKGLFLNIPNDIFNNNKRIYYTNEGKKEFIGIGSSHETVLINEQWLNIDDCMSVFLVNKNEGLRIYRPSKRQIGLKRYQQKDTSHDIGMLYADEICSTIIKKESYFDVDADTVLLDTGFIIKAGLEARETMEHMAKMKRMKIAIHCSENIRTIMDVGEDGREYILIFNTGHKTENLTIVMEKGCLLMDAVTDKKIDYKYNGKFMFNIEENAAKLLYVQC